MVLPPDYLRPPSEHPLVDPAVVESDFIRVKVRVSLSDTFCDRFELGVQRLLDEVGPRPTTGPPRAYLDNATTLTQCDVEEPALPNSLRGLVEFGISTKALPTDLGLPLILALASYMAAYSYILEYNLIDINFPESVLAGKSYPGPRFGPSFVPGTGVTRLGMILKPRFTTDLDFLRKLVLDIADGGLDYLTDDELTVASQHVPFERRVETVVRALDEVAQATGRRPVYIANVTGDLAAALRRAEQARGLGADGVMINVFAMGYDLAAQLANDPSFSLGVVANGLGLGIATRGPFRMSTELLVKLARLSGSDAVYTGPFVGLLHSSEHSAVQFRRALTQPYSRLCRRRAAAAVMSGGVGLPEIVHNCSVYKGPIFLSMGYHLAEHLLAGIPCGPLVECIREVAGAVIQGGTEQGRHTVERLAKKGTKYRAILKAIRAEAAVSI
jgi:hypothetical protein